MKTLIHLFIILSLFISTGYAQMTEHTEAETDQILLTINPTGDGDLDNETWWIKVNNLLLNNVTAEVDPSVNDDANGGYSVGSIWQNTDTPSVWICSDATAGAAVWTELSSGTAMSNPMTAAEDLIIGGTSGAPTRFPAVADSILGYNSSGELVASQGHVFDDSGPQIVDDADSTKAVQFTVGAASGETSSVHVRDEDGWMDFSKIYPYIHTSDTTLPSWKCREDVHYIATAGVDLTLPALGSDTGYNLNIYTAGAYLGSIIPNASNNFLHNGVATTNGNAIPNNSSAGDYWKLRQYDADTWYLESNIGDGEGSPPSTSCQSHWAPSLSNSGPTPIGTWHQFMGGTYIPTASTDVCAIDVYVRQVNGTIPSNYNYYLRVFSINQSTYLPTGIVATSDAIPGDELVSGTWMSTNVGLITFSSNFTLSASTEYAFSLFLDTDGDTSDATEIDTSNNWDGAYDNISGDVGGGRHYMDYNGSTYTMYYHDNTATFLMKVHADK